MLQQVMGAADSFSDGQFTVGDVTSGIDLGLGALSAFMDPVGALVGAALGPLYSWMAANCPFIKEPLDLLAGDPVAIQSRSDAWNSISIALVEQGTRHVEYVQNDLPTWQFTDGSNPYRDVARSLNESFQGAASAAENAGKAIAVTGSIVSALREAIWGVVTELMTSLVTQAVIAAAAAIPSLGSSIAAYTAWASAKVGIVMGKISKAISKVCTRLADFVGPATKLGRAFTRAAEYFAQLATSYGRQAGRNLGAQRRADGIDPSHPDASEQAGLTHQSVEQPEIPGNDVYDKGKEVPNSYEDSQSEDADGNPRPTPGTIPDL